MVKKVIEKIKFLKDPVDYCRKLGVVIGDESQIMGTHHPFGTEPYLIKIGNHVRINNGVQFITHDGGVWVLRKMKELDDQMDLSDIDLFGKIIVGDNVQIGSNAMILPGVIIGSNVIIGAGAVVTKNIPDNSVAIGIPARVIETIDEYFFKNRNMFDHTKSYSKEKKKQYLMKKYVNNE